MRQNKLHIPMPPGTVGGKSVKIYDPKTKKGKALCGQWWVLIADDHAGVTCNSCHRVAKLIANNIKKSLGDVNGRRSNKTT